MYETDNSKTNRVEDRRTYRQTSVTCKLCMKRQNSSEDSLRKFIGFRSLLYFRGFDKNFFHSFFPTVVGSVEEELVTQSYTGTFVSKKCKYQRTPFIDRAELEIGGPGVPYSTT